jgi:hypothetical protein
MFISILFSHKKMYMKNYNTMKVSITLTTALTFILANGVTSQVQVEVGSTSFKQKLAIPNRKQWNCDFHHYNLFFLNSELCHSPIKSMQTPNLRSYVEAATGADAVHVCDTRKKVTGRKELTGCSKAKTFTRSDGACSGYSTSYALAGYESAEDCANYCMIDEKGLATLIGFNFDCNVCEW